MEFRILGPLEVLEHGVPVDVTRPKARALLTYLLLHANEVVSTDRLVDQLWGAEPPRTAVAALQNVVSQLRKAIGGERLVSRPPGYALVVKPDELDLTRFERAVAEAADEPAAERADRLRGALAMWRGEPLAEAAFEPFADGEARRLEELRLNALEERMAADLELTHHAGVVGELELLVADQPLRERLRAQLMVALYRSGRQAEALAVYQDGRKLLREELGLEPSDELRALERAILRHDPSLGAATAPAADGPAPTTSRRVVTVLFADVTGSTALGESLDPEALRDVLNSWFAVAQATIERHGGTVEKFVGDEVMAAFGVPVSHEDDALRALRAAWELRDALEELSVERGLRLEARTGVSTGEVVAGDATSGGTFVTGDAVNIGKRLEEIATPGEIVLGRVTLSLVRDAVDATPLGPLRLRGRAEPVHAARLERIREGAAGVALRLDSPLIGRDAELATLRAAFELARDERRCIAAVVLGDAGIGKTRLATEFVEGLDATVLVGRCTSYGDGATYLPLTDLVRDATTESPLEALVAGAEDADEIAERVSALASGAGSIASGEASWAVRRFVEALARDRPVVVVLEDLQWAEQTFLDLVEYLADWTSGAPVLLVLLARPDVLEDRAQWGTPGVARTVVRLAPLADEDSVSLLEALDADVDDLSRNAIVARAEGNPLFVEQLLAHVHEAGGGELPLSVETLLAARLDRLDLSERSVVQHASVVGRDFWRGAVLALSPPNEAPAVSRALMSLVRKGLVRPGRSTMPREDAFRFDHALIRDAAYATVPKARRVELHEGAARWLDEHGQAVDELVGYHLEHAHRFAREIGEKQDDVGRLARAGGERLGRAGMRAFQLGDLPAARNLLGRATALLEDERYGRELGTELAIVVWASGDAPAALSMLDETVARARAADDEAARKRAELEGAHIRLYTEGGAAETVLELARSALVRFERDGNERALARAWLMVAIVETGFFCRNGPGLAAAERAIDHYRRSGWPIATPAATVATSLYFGPVPASIALETCEELRRDRSLGRAGAADVSVYEAGLLAFADRFDEARALLDDATATKVELGQTLSIAITADPMRGAIEILAGDLDVAERAYRSSAETCERLGATAHLSTHGAELAAVLVAIGRFDEAARWIDVARRHATERDVSAQFSWRAARALLLAERGDRANAEQLALEAERIVGQTDALTQRGNVHSTVAHVYRAMGRDGDARSALERALAAYEAKGNLPAARNAREALAGPLASVAVS